MDDLLVEHERRDLVSVLTMVYRPYNLLGPKLMGALATEFSAAKEAGSRAIILRSGLRHFCAGADVSLFTARAERGGRSESAISGPYSAFTNDETLRYEALAKTASGTQQDAQRAWAANQEAQAAVMSAQAGLTAAQRRLDVIRADIQQAEAAARQALAVLETARVNLGYTEIRSPIGGYVGNRDAQVGEDVSEGTYLLSVTPSHRLWVGTIFKEDPAAMS